MWAGGLASTHNAPEEDSDHCLAPRQSDLLLQMRHGRATSADARHSLCVIGGCGLWPSPRCRALHTLSGALGLDGPLILSVANSPLTRELANTARTGMHTLQ